MRPLEILPIKKDDPAASAFAWLLESGIQDTSENSQARGGVNAWFDLRSQSYLFFYSEITGYAVNAFLFYYSVTGEVSYLDAAIQAADWLLKTQYPENGLIRTRVNRTVYHGSYFDSWIFTFDQWVVIYGLSNLSQAAGKPVYLEAAQRMARFLIKHTVREDGLFYPIFDVENKKPLAPGDKWSRQSGSFHAKALLALSKLQGLSRDDVYHPYAQRLAERVLSLQQGNGRFITQDDEESTHLHPHLYSLEGLLSLWLSEKDEKCLLAVEKGLKWVLNHQLENGVLYSSFKNGSFLPYVRADILAQSLRLGTILLQQGLLKESRFQLERLREKLLSYQILAGSQKGGFLYGQEQDGIIHYHVNAWVTMFAAQALWLYDSFLPANQLYDMSFFV